MAPSTQTTAIPASAAVPFLYRLIITTIEPLFAASGALLVFRDPGAYTATMTRGAVPFDAPSTFMYTATGGSWLYFAFVEAVVLRLFDDLRLWRMLCVGMLLSDAAYCHSAAQAVGGWAAWADLAAWTRDDYVVFCSTMPMVLARILIVLGIGLRKTDAAKKRV